MPRDVLPEVVAQARDTLALIRDDLVAEPTSPPPIPCPLQPDPDLEGRRPRGRTFEDVADIVADALEHGGTGAAKRHRMQSATLRSLVRRWQHHPRIVELVAERWPGIVERQRERSRAAVEEIRADMIAMVDRALGRT